MAGVAARAIGPWRVLRATLSDPAMRRLQVAAETGQALGFAFRDARAADNPSPAALRLLFERTPSERCDASTQVRVLKCRGGNAPALAIALDA